LWPVEAFASVPERFAEGWGIIGIGALGVREDVHDVLARNLDDPSDPVTSVRLIDLGPASVLFPQVRRMELGAGDRLEPKPSQRLHAPRRYRRKVADAEQTALGVLVLEGRSQDWFGVAQDPSEGHEVVPRPLQPIPSKESISTELQELLQCPLNR
jgi:hypothetical protein